VVSFDKYLNLSKSSYRNFKFGDVNVDSAERIAKICVEEGVPRLIHVSHLNASPASQSQFYRTKAEGEERVKTAFPNATIFRPGAMYGYEDKLLNNIASECRFTVMLSALIKSPSSLAYLVEAEPGRYQNTPCTCEH